MYLVHFAFLLKIKQSKVVLFAVVLKLQSVVKVVLYRCHSFVCLCRKVRFSTVAPTLAGNGLQLPEGRDFYHKT